MSMFLLNNGQLTARYETHTWAIGGEVKVPAGDADFIPPMFVSKLAGTTLTLVRVRTRINSGTSATVKMVKTTAGTPSNLVTGIAATTASTDSADINTVLDHSDEIRPEITAVSGTPKNITITATFRREA